jgi:hypothetical protein
VQQSIDILFPLEREKKKAAGSRTRSLDRVSRSGGRGWAWIARRTVQYCNVHEASENPSGKIRKRNSVVRAGVSERASVRACERASTTRSTCFMVSRSAQNFGSPIANGKGVECLGGRACDSRNPPFPKSSLLCFRGVHHSTSQDAVSTSGSYYESSTDHSGAS